MQFCPICKAELLFCPAGIQSLSLVIKVQQRMLMRVGPVVVVVVVVVLIPIECLALEERMTLMGDVDRAHLRNQAYSLPEHASYSHLHKGLA